MTSRNEIQLSEAALFALLKMHVNILVKTTITQRKDLIYKDSTQRRFNKRIVSVEFSFEIC